MQWTLPSGLAPPAMYSSFRMKGTVVGCFEWGGSQPAGPRQHNDRRRPDSLLNCHNNCSHGGRPLFWRTSRRLPGLEVPRSTCIPALRCSARNLCGRVRGSPLRKGQGWAEELGISSLERSDAAKVAKIGFRCVKNRFRDSSMRGPAGFCTARTPEPQKHSHKKRKRKEKKNHKIFPFIMFLPPKKTRLRLSKDRAGSAQAAASAYFTDFSYVRTNLQL